MTLNSRLVQTTLDEYALNYIIGEIERVYIHNDAFFERTSTILVQRALELLGQRDAGLISPYLRAVAGDDTVD